MIKKMENRRAAWDLFLVSALGLFVELMFIRWVASEVRVVAFYKNFALIAAFLGLGIGFAVARRENTLRWFDRRFLPLLSLSVIIVLILGRTLISEVILLNRENSQEFIWAGDVINLSPAVVAALTVLFYVVILTLFILITLLFIPLGQITAEKFGVFSPLQGYTINVMGSLAGILGFTLISLWGWPPGVWFLITAVVTLYFLRQNTTDRQMGIPIVLALLPVLLTFLWPTGASRTVWSPYYRIDINPLYEPPGNDLQTGYELSVNQAWHQRLWNLAPSFVAANFDRAAEHFENTLAEYDAPFDAYPNSKNVLIVGAGTGNDVAAAQRAGAQHVVAVEIDPKILELGIELHPENPYASSNPVKIVNQDARSFFRTDQDQYDLIVFGRLDSHTLFSTASSVRLDNFVYTIESMRDVKRILAQDGLLALSFGVPNENEWVGLRLYRVLSDVFRHAPQVYQFPSGDILLLIGHTPITEPLLNNPRLLARTDYSYREDIPVATDDWPYLYLRNGIIPNTYLIALAGIIVSGYVFVRRTLPDFKQFNPHFFFMGTAFFLLETKSITEIALLLGSTWVVNSAVIAAILFMIVLANILIERWQLKDPRLFYVLLALTLLFNYFVPIGNLLGLALIWRVIFAGLMQALPLFFAGLIFAITFSQTKSIEIALGSNLLGAVIGGIFEYTSLVLGIRSLYLLALAFYLLSALPVLQSRTAS